MPDEGNRGRQLRPRDLGTHAVIDSVKVMQPRPVRFPIHAPMRYRIIGEQTWYEGTTMNMSSRGILFTAHTGIQAGTRIEIRLTLPTPSIPASGTPVSCRGTVVRSTESPVVAAKISGARIHRQ